MAYLDNKGFTDDGTPNLRINGNIVVKGNLIAEDGVSFVSSSFNYAYSQKSINYTLGLTDFTVECLTGSLTLTLPSAVNLFGHIYNIKNSGTGELTINTTLSQSIDAFTNGQLTLTQYDCLTVQSNNTNWIII